MVYREILAKISEGKGITTNGSKLIFTGNRSFVPGDTVWTDGKYIYGLEARSGVGMLWGEHYYPYISSYMGGFLYGLGIKNFKTKNFGITPYSTLVCGNNNAWWQNGRTSLKWIDIINDNKIDLQRYYLNDDKGGYTIHNPYVNMATITDSGDLITAYIGGYNGDRYIPGCVIFKNDVAEKIIPQVTEPVYIDNKGGCYYTLADEGSGEYQDEKVELVISNYKVVSDYPVYAYTDRLTYIEGECINTETVGPIIPDEAKDTALDDIKYNNSSIFKNIRVIRRTHISGGTTHVHLYYEKKQLNEIAISTSYEASEKYELAVGYIGKEELDGDVGNPFTWEKNNEGNYNLSVLVDVKTIYSDDKKEIVTKKYFKILHTKTPPPVIPDNKEQYFEEPQYYDFTIPIGKDLKGNGIPVTFNADGKYKYKTCDYLGLTNMTVPNDILEVANGIYLVMSQKDLSLVDISKQDVEVQIIDSYVGYGNNFRINQVSQSKIRQMAKNIMKQKGDENG